MKISIITAARNAEATVAQAIRSVAAQSHAGIEHLVLDGRSRDRTRDEIRRVRHARLSLVSEPDLGLYHAINKGILRSTGEVIGLVHADDLLAHRHVLARVADAFRDPAVDAVFGDLDYVAKADPERVIRHWAATPFTPSRLKRGWMPPHPTLFLRRRVFDAFGLYDTSFRIAADYEAVLRMFGSGRIVSVHLPEVLVKMRLGGESNRNLGRILHKSREDYRAIRRHRVGGLATLVAKNLSKLPQFVRRAKGRPGRAPTVVSGGAQPVFGDRNPGFLSHQVDQQPHPAVRVDLVDRGDEIGKWAGGDFDLIAGHHATGRLQEP